MEKHEPIGVALVGAGYWGPNLIRNFNSLEDCSIQWVCDKKPGRLQFIRERFPEIPLTDDLRQVLSDPRVDAVVLATPVSTHRDLALRALEAGKHVFVEKPLADTTLHAQEIAEAGRAAGRVVAVGHIFVYNPAVVRLREMVREGKIGRLCYAESSRVNLGPPASEVNVIWDLAVHDIAILLDVWGQEPVGITAYGNRYLHPQLIDAAFLHLDFADGSMAQHHVSWLSPERVRRFFVAGSRGSLHFDDMRVEDKLRYIDQGEDSRVGLSDNESKELYYKSGEIKNVELPAGEPLRAECEHFIECIRTGANPHADAFAGVAVVRILEAACDSIANHSTRIMLKEMGAQSKTEEKA